MKHFQSGFTLIELMIVVAIIGILAAVAMPAYQDYVVRSQVTESQTLASGLQLKVATYFTSSGAFPGSTAQTVCGESGSCAGGSPTDHQGHYIAQVAVGTGGAVTVTFGNQANAVIAGRLLTMRPYTDAAENVGWVCGRSSIPGTVTLASGAVDQTTVEARYLPNACK